MKTIKGSSTQFAFILTLWATTSLVILGFMMSVVARLDFSFFEANGMLKADFMREALFQQLFLAVESKFFLIVFVGLGAVASTAYIFAEAQCAYVRRMRDVLALYAERLEVPQVKDLGPLSMHVADFLEVMHLRIKRESREKIDEAIEKALRDWPQNPRISGSDIFQFALVSFVLSILFSLICATFFMQVSDRIVELGQTVARYTNPAGPQFLREQYELVNLLMGSIIVVTAAAFVAHGVRFGKRLSESYYALLRDLKKFMQGDFNQRLFLRSGDPVSEHVSSMNESLARLQKKV